MKIIRKSAKASKRIKQNICPCMKKNAICNGIVRWVPNPLAISEAKVQHYISTILEFKSLSGLEEESSTEDSIADLLYNFASAKKILDSENVPVQLLSEAGIDQMAITHLFGSDKNLLSQVSKAVSASGATNVKVNQVLGVIPPVTKKLFGGRVSGMIFVVKLDDLSRPVKEEQRDDKGNVIKKFQSKIAVISSDPSENQFLQNWLNESIAPKAEKSFVQDNKLVLQDEIRKEVEKKKREISTLKEVLLKVAKGTNFIKELDNLEVTSIPTAEVIEAKVPGCDFAFVLKVTFEGKVYPEGSIRTSQPDVFELVDAPKEVKQKA